MNSSNVVSIIINNWNIEIRFNIVDIDSHDDVTDASADINTVNINVNDVSVDVNADDISVGINVADVSSDINADDISVDVNTDDVSDDQADGYVWGWSWCTALLWLSCSYKQDDDEWSSEEKQYIHQRLVIGRQVIW